ncbi:uncharacterized protein J3D65DRAFT_624621 [Phyllosticta citribraziliensis]|uniref:BTB domain-containing protein n=1 Tax=Phyllosticta citribraziliensis TaxID=989973 RepID=A0ABR1LRM4_9PEZI
MEVETNTLNGLDGEIRQIPLEERIGKDEPGFWSELGLPIVNGACHDGVKTKYPWMKRYLEKGKFADMTVSDSTGKKYLVHKVVLGSASLVLAKMIEELSGCSQSTKKVDLEMHDHRPEIVEQGLYFMYNQHYYEPLDLRTFHEQPRPKQEGEDFRPRILFSTEVHAFAVSYYISQLEEYALKQISLNLPHEAIYFPEDLPGLLLQMCKIMPGEQAGSEGVDPNGLQLHKALSTVCAAKIECFLNDSEFRTRYPRVFLDAVKHLAGGTRILGRQSLHLDDKGESFYSQNFEETVYANQIEILLNDKNLRIQNLEHFYNCVRTLARLRCRCTSCRYRLYGDNRVFDRATNERRTVETYLQRMSSGPEQ